ncbi:ABC transporter permease [Roseinatronobacter sp. S2]|uniref:ABC transporter permease n=1 Tax=Roseinatronobacter sp. S2 TaxID=3035471 RepID=UPI00240E9DE4|nr:ABC transporter permease subunit [Roseinatronobacter sp. S2]WFE77076.1 ABC transporter permease subunit [Roseinatronobacter sp. S2]
MTPQTVMMQGAERRLGALRGLALVAVPVALVAALIIAPIFLALADTVVLRDDAGIRLTLAPYVFFFSDAYSLRNLGLTIWTTMVSTLILLALAVPIAIYLRFAFGRWPAVVQALAIFPLFVPSIILAYAFVRVLGPNGMADMLLAAMGLPRLRSPYLTVWGPVIGFVWDNLPLAVVILMSGLANVSRSAVEAARDVGAGKLMVFRHIILPRILVSILVAASFVVLGIFSAFTFPYLLGPASPEMMGPFMQRTFGDVLDPVQARAQAVVTFIFCAVFGWFYVRAIARNRKADAT